MTDELLDLYSASGTPLGRAKPRSAVHRDGDWHKTFHCWMCYRGEAGQEMLILQKRSPHVETWPNRFDITAAGHYRTGEDLSGGVREIAEELGVSVTAAQLIPAGWRVHVDEFVPGRIIHEFHEVYFCVNNLPLRDYRPDAQEVSGLAAIPCLHLLQLFAGERAALTVPGIVREQGRGEPAFRPQEFAISAQDFVPCLDHYYQRVAICAMRILQGERYIWI